MKIEDFDWRMHAITTIAKDVPSAGPGAPSFHAGSLVYTVTTVDWDSRRLRFARPSTLKIAYDIALTTSIESISSMKQVQLIQQDIGVMVRPDCFSHLYDFFEKYMITVIFSLLTLEVFCNFAIGTKLPKNTVRLCLDKKPRSYTAEELQKPNISLVKKMTVILPTLLEKPSLKDANPRLWDDIEDMITLRNAITHMTPFDVFTPVSNNNNNFDKESIFAKLVNSNPSDAPRRVLDVVDYYKNGALSEKWVEQMREQYLIRYPK